MSAGSFLSGFASGGMAMKTHKLEEERLDTYAEDVANRPLQLPMPESYEGYSGSSRRGRSLPRPGGSGGGSTSSSGGGSRSPSASRSAGKAIRVNDPVADDLPAHARAFLNTISAKESGGAYNVRYTPNGAATFDVSKGQHPRIYEDGPHGPSSAAGRYQFTASTWDDMGGGEFTERNQDHRAWKLAQDRYRATTGGNLDSVLQSDGVSSGILESLAPTWAAFKNNKAHPDLIATYQDSYSRYNQSSQPTSQPASQPEPRQLRVAPRQPIWGWTDNLSMGEPA